MNYQDITRQLENLPRPDSSAAAAATEREANLTKPAGSLGRLEELSAWCAAWQGRHPPVLDDVRILVFAGNHGVTAQGVSAFPPEVTHQMVANFAAGGAAINQLAATQGADLRVIDLDLDSPTADFVTTPAISEEECAVAFSAGYEAVAPAPDALIVGEMGIGNTTSAAALATAIFGGAGADWAGRGTGLDDAGVALKAEVIDRGMAANPGATTSGLDALATRRPLGSDLREP